MTVNELNIKRDLQVLVHNQKWEFFKTAKTLPCYILCVFIVSKFVLVKSNPLSVGSQCFICCVHVRVIRNIYKNDRFPAGTKVVGYARSALTVDNLKEKCKPYLKVSHVCA